MNIFWLDHDLEKTCQSMVDSHVVKMPTEHCQLMSTALHVCGWDSQSSKTMTGEEPIIYKKTHENHPCAVWVRESFSNFALLRKLTILLCEEYTYRYGRRHKCHDIALNLPDPCIDDVGVTPLPLSMPNGLRSDDPIQSYRLFYSMSKRHLFKWKKRTKPKWILPYRYVSLRRKFPPHRSAANFKQSF